MRYGVLMGFLVLGWGCTESSNEDPEPVAGAMGTGGGMAGMSTGDGGAAAMDASPSGLTPGGAMAGGPGSGGTPPDAGPMPTGGETGGGGNMAEGGNAGENGGMGGDGPNPGGMAAGGHGGTGPGGMATGGDGGDGGRGGEGQGGAPAPNACGDLCDHVSACAPDLFNSRQECDIVCGGVFTPAQVRCLLALPCDRLPDEAAGCLEDRNDEFCADGRTCPQVCDAVVTCVESECEANGDTLALLDENCRTLCGGPFSEDLRPFCLADGCGPLLDAFVEDFVDFAPLCGR